MSDYSPSSSSTDELDPNAQSRAKYQRLRRRKKRRISDNYVRQISDSSPDETDVSENELNRHNESGSPSDGPASLAGEAAVLNEVDNIHSEAVLLEEETSGPREGDTVQSDGNDNLEAHGVFQHDNENSDEDNNGSGIESNSEHSVNGNSTTESVPDNDQIFSDSDESDRSDVPDDDDDDERLFEGSRITLGGLLLAILTLFMRHKLTGQCLSDILALIAMIIPPGSKFTSTLYKFKKYFFMIGQSPVMFHYFCSGCESLIQQQGDVCDHCGPDRKINFFLELPLIPQIQSMFLRAGFYESLQFRFTRIKKFADNYEDLCDGQIYKDQVQNSFLSNPNHISFKWYSDGVSIYKSAKFSIWPMFLVINELNYKMRTSRENIILAGLWFGASKPNPNVFLLPLHDDLKKFESDGHLFEKLDEPPALIKGKLLCGVCDLQAKCRFMRFKQWNGYFGCTVCMIRGQSHNTGVDGTVHVYPYSPNVDIRNNDDTLVFAEQAVRNRHYDANADVYGVLGPSLLYFMLPNMILCMGIDAMHGVFLGVMKLLTHLYFDASFGGLSFSIYHLLNIVDARFKNLRPPSIIQRMPRSIKTQIAFWKAQEYKYWFLYYSLPVLLGILSPMYWHHHCKLVSAIALLHQNSISVEQIDVAKELLHSYLSDFQNLYTLRYMGINVHQLIHIPDVVQNMGPLWVYSCCFFWKILTAL